MHSMMSWYLQGSLWHLYRWCYNGNTVDLDFERNSLLPPGNEVCEGYVFTGVCLSTVGGVPGQVHPQGGTPPGQIHSTWAGIPPGRYTPRQVQAAGQVHPSSRCTIPPGQVHHWGRYTPWQALGDRQVPLSPRKPSRQVRPPSAGTPPGQIHRW